VAVRQVRQSAVATPALGLHSLLEAGDELLAGEALAKVLGHVAFSLCESERPAALGLEEAQLAPGTVAASGSTQRQGADGAIVTADGTRRHGARD